MFSPRKVTVSAVVVVLFAFVGWKYLAGGGDTVSTVSQNSPAPQSGRKGPAAGGGGVSVVAAVATKEDFPVIKRSIGWVESPAVVVIRSRTDSQILEQHITDGQMVKAGDLLFVLDDRELQAQLAKDQATLLRDQALHGRTQLDLARVQSLNAKGSASQQQLDQSTADERSAAANIKSDEASVALSKQKLSYTRIYAPIDGRVGAVQVAPGNIVNANNAAALVTITRVSPIRVTFTLPERDLAVLKSAIAASTPPRVRVFPSGARKPLAEGQLNFLDSAVDIPSGTITVKATFENADLALWPGQYVDVELALEPLHDVAVVPTVAVQPGQSGSFVYLVKPDNSIELRKVVVAGSDNERLAISSGLDGGDRVVIDGQTGLVAGAKVRPTDTVATRQTVDTTN